MLSKLLILSTTYFTKKNIISTLPDALRGTELQRAGDSRILPATAPSQVSSCPAFPRRQTEGREGILGYSARVKLTYWWGCLSGAAQTGVSPALLETGHKNQ